MHVGVCRLSLRLQGSRGLKEKRKVARSITARVRNRYNVAIAEVEDNDLWQRLTLGIVCVSNNSRHANEMLLGVAQYIEEATAGDAELLDYEVEMVSGI